MGTTTSNRSFIGGGTIYLREKGADAGLQSVGNSDDFSFAINEDKKSQRNFQQAGGGNIASQSAITDVTATINGLSFQPNALAIALRSLVNTVAASAVVAEVGKGYLNSFMKFAKIPDMASAVTITNTGAAVTYIEGTDYFLKNTGIFIPATGSAITDKLALEYTYTSLESYNIQGITRAAVEYEIVFDGVNDADNGKAVAVQCHKVKFSPSSALALISEDYGSLPMNFEVLADTDKNGTSISQYFSVEMAA